MNATELEAKVSSLVAAKKTLNWESSGAIAALKDKTIDLTVRWESFLALSENSIFDRDDPYSSGFYEILDPGLSLYDDFSIERYVSTKYVEFYYEIMNTDEDDNEDIFKSRKNIEEWKEAVLQSGYSSFTYDW